MNKKLLVSVFLCFFVLSLGIIAQEEEKMIARQERKKMKIKALALDKPGYIIYVDATIGHDTDGKGTEKKPYKTIGKALEVAESGVTIKVGPGAYSESFWITTLDRITIEGSGNDRTTIDGQVWADWCKEFTITGFKIKGDPNYPQPGYPDYKVGVYCWNVGWAVIEDCIIDCPYDAAVGIIAERSLMVVRNSHIINIEDQGSGVEAYSADVVLSDCKIEGKWWGVWAGARSNVRLIDCEIKGSVDWAISVHANSRLGIRGCLIHGNYDGIHAENEGVVELYGMNQIYDNTRGIYLGPGGYATLYSDIHISGNSIGIKVTQASILHLRHLCEPNITSNDIGIEVSEFAHAFLGDCSINGNTLDVHIHTGGQAICNHENIEKIKSDCRYCQLPEIE